MIMTGQVKDPSEIISHITMGLEKLKEAYSKLVSLSSSCHSLNEDILINISNFHKT